METRQSQQRFFAAVGQMPYVQVVLGRLRPSGPDYVQKGVDTRIVVDLLGLAHRDSYDTAILVSGDGDFACALEAVGELGKNVENAYFRSGRSLQLENCSDRFHEITPGMIRQCIAEDPEYD